MKKITVLCLGLAFAGCAPVAIDLDENLTPIAQALVSDAGMTSTAPDIQTDQPEPYASIVQKNYEEMRFRFDSNLRDLQIMRTRADQSRLPQITPGASVGTSGAAVLDLNIRQVLFNGNLYAAQFQDANVKAISRQISLIEALNDDVSDDIGTYLEYHENLERERVLRDLASQLADLLDLAETRLRGGISAADEVTLFQLKLSEIETEVSIARSNAEVEQAALEDIDVSASPADFANTTTHLPLKVLSALAEVEQAESALALAKLNAQPQVVLEAQGGFDLATGAPSSNAGLRVEAEPLKLGGNTDIEAAEQDLFLAKRELDETAADIERDARRLHQQIQALNAQKAQTQSLVAQSQARLDAFEEQFFAGSVGLSEAVSLIDTVRRSMESEVDVRFRILNLQKELATVLGHFWTL